MEWFSRLSKVVGYGAAPVAKEDLRASLRKASEQAMQEKSGLMGGKKVEEGKVEGRRVKGEGVSRGMTSIFRRILEEGANGRVCSLEPFFEVVTQWKSGEEKEVFLIQQALLVGYWNALLQQQEEVISRRHFIELLELLKNSVTKKVLDCIYTEEEKRYILGKLVAYYKEIVKGLRESRETGREEVLGEIKKAVLEWYEAQVMLSNALNAEVSEEYTQLKKEVEVSRFEKQKQGEEKREVRSSRRGELDKEVKEVLEKSIYYKIKGEDGEKLVLNAFQKLTEGKEKGGYWIIQRETNEELADDILRGLLSSVLKKYLKEVGGGERFGEKSHTGSLVSILYRFCNGEFEEDNFFVKAMGELMRIGQLGLGIGVITIGGNQTIEENLEKLLVQAGVYPQNKERRFKQALTEVEKRDFEMKWVKGFLEEGNELDDLKEALLWSVVTAVAFVNGEGEEFYIRSEELGICLRLVNVQGVLNIFEDGRLVEAFNQSILRHALKYLGHGNNLISNQKEELKGALEKYISCVNEVWGAHWGDLMKARENRYGRKGYEFSNLMGEGFRKLEDGMSAYKEKKVFEIN